MSEPAFSNQKRVDWGNLRTHEPISRVFGFDRGQCIDRYYIESFLARHSGDIHGRVMEVADANYTKRFGGERVTRSDVLHTPPGGRSATIVGDLVSGENIPRDAFDCVILTQVLPFIFDVRSALKTVCQSLRLGGVALVTVPGISPISRYDMDRWGDYWRFTDLSIRRLFGDVFGTENVSVNIHGNALAATAFVQGMVVEDLSIEELDLVDRDYQVILTARAVRSRE